MRSKFVLQVGTKNTPAQEKKEKVSLQMTETGEHNSMYPDMEEIQKKRQKNSEKKKKWRNSRSEIEKIAMKEKDKHRKRRARQNMSEEKKRAEREKDAKRKAEKRKKEREYRTMCTKGQISISSLLNWG